MTKSYEELLSENRVLRRSLEESQELLRAISSGEVDALVVSGPECDRVFTLNGADRAYRIIIEAMNDGAVTIDLEGIILYCNRHFAEMARSPLEKVIGSSIYDFMPQADRAAFCVLSEEQGRGELTLKARDDSTLPVYISINSMQISESQKASCIVVTDLTEQKQREEIVAAEKLVRSVIEQANEAILVCNGSGKIIYFSNAVLMILGHDPSLQSFDELFDLRSPFGKMQSPVSMALQGETLQNAETSLERSDGILFYFVMNAGPLKSAEGKILGCVVTLTDITERKLAERSLQESEARFRSVLDNSQDVIYRLNLQTGRYEYISPSVETVVGFSPDELMVQDADALLAMIHPDDLPALLEMMVCLEDTGQGALEYRQLSKKGDYRWISNHMSLIKDRNGQPLYRDGNIRDITERKLAETEREQLLADISLEKSRWQATVDNMLDPVTVCDAQGCVTYINPAYQRLIERPQVDGLSMKSHPEYYQLYQPDGTLFPAEDLPLQKAALTGEDVHEVELIQCNSRGLEFAAIFSASPLRDTTGKIIGAVAVGHDITEKKKAEKDLRESEERYRSLFNSMTEGFALHEIICDAQGEPCDFRFLEINPAFERLTGLKREDVVGKTHNAVLPNDDPLWVKAYGEVALTGRPAQFEKYSPALERYYEVFAYRPAPFQFAVAFLDVTMRKQAEISLQDNLKRFYTVLSVMYSGILLVTNEGKIEYANQALCDFFGQEDSPEKIVGITSREMIEKISSGFPNPEEAIARTEEIVRLGEPVKGEEVALHGGRTCLRDFIPLNVDGKPCGRLWHHNDITERKRMEVELRDSEKRFKLALKNAPITVAAQDLNLRFIWAYNQRTVQPEGVIGKTDNEIFIPEDAERLIALKRKAIETGKELREQIWLTRNEKPMFLEIYLEPMLDDAGEVTGIGIATMDLTMQKNVEEELKESKDLLEQRVLERTEELNAINEELRIVIGEHERSEKALLRAKNEAEEAMKAKAAFLANMSHELRTPMNSVIGFTGLLLDENLTPEQKDYLECIRNSGEALMSLINDVLDFSKMERKKVDLELQVFDLRTITEEALDMLAAQAAKKGLEMNYSFDRNVPEAIIGDPGKLRQILSNLLSNAVKFTKTGEIEVDVSLDPEQQEIHFAVKDTGIGIPPEGISKLFQPFIQLDMTYSRGHEGTGLGLAISKRLVELMEGRIWVESEAGKGSIFHFTISAETAPSEPKPFLTGNFKGKRLLVLAGSSTIRRILGRHAHAWGIVPMMAATPQEIAELLQRDNDYDAVIVDVGKVDNLSAIIRVHGIRGGLPFIALSPLGQNMPPGLFQAVLTKPLKHEQLYRVLQDILEKGKAIEPIENHKTEKCFGPLRILLAEDNASNQKVTLHILNRLGYRADAVVNGQEALVALQRRDYDIVLMDVEMPVMDGLTATRKIRERWPGNGPKIIAITAYALQGDRERCLDAGMDDYIAKPVRKWDLSEKLDKFKSK
jgi:PAS domain S-box-containing protein